MIFIEWLRPMQYKNNVDEVSTTFIGLLLEEIDKNVEQFNTYKTMKIKMLMQIKVPNMDKRLLHIHF